MEWLATAIGGITAGPPDSAVAAAKMVYAAWVRFGDIVEPVPPEEGMPRDSSPPRRLLNQWPSLIGDFRADSRKFGKIALEVLVGIMQKGHERNRLVAAREIIDRGWGPAPKPVDLLMVQKRLSFQSMN